MVSPLEYLNQPKRNGTLSKRNDNEGLVRDDSMMEGVMGTGNSTACFWDVWILRKDISKPLS